MAFNLKEAAGAFGGPLVSLAAGELLGGGESPTSTVSPTLTNISGGGLFDTSFGEGGGNIGLSPEMQAFQQQQFGQIASDPFAAAEQQFNRLESILAPGRERSRQAEESRLFSQGRLGSTGGGLEQQASREAIEQQRKRSLMSSLGESQQMRQQALSNLFGIQQGGLQQLQAGAFGGSTSSTQQPGIASQIGTGFTTGGLNQLSGAFSNLGSGGESGFVDPFVSPLRG